MNTNHTLVKCPWCHSPEVTEEGPANEVVTWRCLSCKRAFVINDQDRSRKARHLISGNIQYIRDYIREKEVRHFAGKGVFCTVCGMEFRAFAPYHAWYASKTVSGQDKPLEKECRTFTDRKRCPNCGSHERQRLLMLFLREKTSIFKGHEQNVLEFAPEIPFLRIFSSLTSTRYFPADLNPEQEKYASWQGSIIRADINGIPFEDNFFDVVLCSHVLEHVPDDRKGMREIHRVLKPGGWCIFQVPVDHSLETTCEDPSLILPQQREQAFGQSDHLRMYGRDFSQRLAESGFQVDEIHYAGQWDEVEILRLGIDRQERIYYCTKLPGTVGKP